MCTYENKKISVYIKTSFPVSPFCFIKLIFTDLSVVFENYGGKLYRCRHLCELILVVIRAPDELATNKFLNY